jgi:hypothetical protein
MALSCEPNQELNLLCTGYVCRKAIPSEMLAFFSNWKNDRSAIALEEEENG